MSADESEVILGLIEKEIELAPVDAISEDLRSITLRILSSLGQSVNFTSLEAKAQLARAFDIGSLETGAELLERAVSKIGLGASVSLGDNKNVDVAERLRLLREHISIIKAQEVEFPRIEILLRLELALNQLFKDVLMCFPPFSEALNPLKELLREKFDSLNDDDKWELWRILRTEFRKKETENDGLNSESSSVPEGFLSEPSTSQLSDKLATYLIFIKPQLVRELIGTAGSYPVTVLGVARILALRDSRSLEELSEDEISLLRNLSRLGALWDRLLAGKESELFTCLQVPSNGLIAKGEWRLEFEKELNSAHKGEIQLLRLAISTLRKIRSFSELFILRRDRLDDVVNALNQHKLGLEVVKNETYKSLSSRNEEALQRHLCKFLIERDIKAFGSKFGTSEIDLLCEGGGEIFVIETKLFKKPPPPNQIKRSLVQLLQYLDIHPQARGVLLLYNLSDVPIGRVNKWINGRIWVLAVNTGKLTPSKMEDCIELAPGANGELLAVSRFRSAKERKKPKREKRTAEGRRKRGRRVKVRSVR